jgi:hypothetical protein
MKRHWGAILALVALLPAGAGAGEAPPTVTVTPQIDPHGLYTIRYDHWTDADERGYGEFIAAIGESDCSTVNRCLHDPANPFRATDPPGTFFQADCADLPYVLRFYYAWKRNLPFAYVSVVEPRGWTRDMRYARAGNAPTERVTADSGHDNGYRVMQTLSDTISTATFRIHPDLEAPLEPDFYSPAITPKSIRPGTVVYDPNGHVATIYKVEPDGRLHYIDAHPDNALTRGFFDQRFVRAWPAVGAGFKNWRPMTLIGYKREKDGTLTGGHVVLPYNAAIADFSVEQYFGTGPRPDDSAWQSGVFTLNKEAMDYYDYVRARLAGGKLEFDPLREVHDMVESNCADLHYRADAVTLAINAGIQNRGEPSRLPPNIYGTDGDWETYSTPSRDARLKTAFKEVRDLVARFMALYLANDPRLKYKGAQPRRRHADRLRQDRRTVPARLCARRRIENPAQLRRRAQAALRDVVRSLSLRRAALGRDRCQGACHLPRQRRQAGVVRSRTEPAQPAGAHLRRPDGLLAGRSSVPHARHRRRGAAGHGRADLSMDHEGQDAELVCYPNFTMAGLDPATQRAAQRRQYNMAHRHTDLLKTLARRRAPTGWPGQARPW